VSQPVKHQPFREHLGVLTTPEIIAKSAEKHSDQIAYRIWRGEDYFAISYTEVYDQVKRLAAGLIELGIAPGDHISILGENRPEWAIAYLAIHTAGAVAVPLDSLWSAKEWRHVIDDASVKMVIVSGRFVADIEGIAQELESLEWVITMEEEDSSDDSMLASVADGENAGTAPMRLVMSDPVGMEFPEVTLDDMAAIIYTSGTTGQSKGVMLSQRNICSNVAAGYQCVEYDESDTFLSILPLHHTFECTCGFLIALYGGASTTYARSFKSRDIIDDIKNTSVTVMLGMPLLFEKMYQGINRVLASAPLGKRALIGGLSTARKVGSVFGKDLSKGLFKPIREKAGMGTVRSFMSGGAALPQNVAEGFNNMGLTLFQGYGLTEMSPITHVNRPGIIHHGSVGPPITGVEHKIVNPNDEGHGEICVRGPNMMVGYYKNDAATAEVIDEDGWFHTGDIGVIDELDRLHISGRIKNMIVNEGGKNIYPEEIEYYINQSPWILESLVHGRPLPGTTSEGVEVIVIPDVEYFDQQREESGEQYLEDDIERIVKDEYRAAVADLASYKRPKEMAIRHEEFEKTSTRKIKRFLYKLEAKT